MRTMSWIISGQDLPFSKIKYNNANGVSSGLRTANTSVNMTTRTWLGSQSFVWVRARLEDKNRADIQ